MKRKLLSLFSLFAFIFILASCGSNTFSVTFDSNQGSAVAAITDVKKGDKISKPADPTRTGFDFKGWYKEVALTTEWVFTVDVVEKDITLYAKWQEKAVVPTKVTVTFNLGYTGATAPTTVEINQGAKATKPADPTRDDFAFLGWFKEGSATAFDFNQAVSANLVLTAKWETTKETETVTLEFNVEKDDIILEVIAGEVIDFELVDIPVVEGYDFMGWYLVDDTKFDVTTPITGALKLIGKYLVRDAKFADYTAITNPSQLVEVMTGKITADQKYFLATDIDMTGITVTHVDDAEFLGIFDGNNKTVSNLKYHTAGRLGLFRALKGATVKDLNITGFDIKSSNERAGILAAEIASTETTIENVHISDSKVSGDNKDNAAGGLVAYINAKATINNVSIVNTEVSASGAIGVGFGGLAGRVNAVGVTISNVFLDVKVTGNKRVGGVLGLLHGNTQDLLLENIVAISELKGDDLTAAVIGKADGNNVNIQMKNVVAQAHYAEGTKGAVGIFLGDGNRKVFTATDNIRVYVDGFAPTQRNNITADELITNIHAVYNATWWAPLTAITENNLWELDADLGIYKLKVADVSLLEKPNHFVVTLDYGYNELKKEISVLANAKLTEFADPTRTDYVFLGWLLGETLYNFETPVTENITLVASWADSVSADLELTFANDRLTLGITLGTEYDLSVEGNNIEVAYFTEANGEFVPVLNEKTNEPLVKDKSWAGFLIGSDGTKYSKGTVGASDYDETHLDMLPANIWLGTQLRNGLSSDGSDMSYHGINWGLSYMFKVVVKITTPDKVFEFDVVYEHKPTHVVEIMDGLETLQQVSVVGGEILPELDLNTSDKVVEGLYLDPEFTTEFELDTVLDKDLTLYVKWAVAINADLDVEYANGRLTFGFELDTDFNFEAEGYQLEIQYFTQVDGDNVPLANSVEDGMPLVKNKSWAAFLIGRDGTKYSKGTVGASDYDEDYLGTIPANTWVGTQLRNGASSDGSSMDYHNINWNHAYIFVIELRLVTPKVTYTFDITYNHEPKFNVTVMDGENTLHVIPVLGGSLLDQSLITKEGQSLEGLYLDSSFETAFDETTAISEDLTLYAKFIEAVTNVYTYGADNPYFATSTEKITDAGTYTIEGTSYTESLKFNGSAFVDFTTTKENAKLKIYVTERKLEDKNAGRIKIVGTTTSKIINLKDHLLAGSDLACIELTLEEAGSFRISRDNKELAVYYVSVTE